LRDSFGGQLAKAIECYGRHYDPQRPGENWYQGINYIALLKRAERDHGPVEAKGNPDAMARAMIEALEPKALPSTDDPWLLASVAEAYLALGRFDKAAEYFGLYTRHPSVDAFQLNGTIRQLEEVWQLKAGAQGAEAILTNLKGALAHKENGFVSLSGDERRAISKAGNIEFQNCFETVTTGGKFINFGLLKRIVACGASVAAIQIKLGQAGRTVGTGFLVKGSDFSPTLSGDKSYILTNAHVMWDHTRNQGIEDKAISPEVARVVFENDQIDGRTDAYGCRVVWQSPSSQLDATLIELDRRVDHTVPLEVAPSTTALSVASETTKGTKLAVLGHPQGGSLAVGVQGSLDEMQGTLVDRGPRSNTENPIFLHYMTPTEPGNSGSPVFEAESWRVVGLHHVGFVEGTRGLPRLGGQAGEQMCNEGIWIESIRAAAKNELSPEPARNGRRKWWG
jgi:S1-C subfamily serine protease